MVRKRTRSNVKVSESTSKDLI